MRGLILCLSVTWTWTLHSKKNIKLQYIYIILYCVVATSACSFSVVKTTEAAYQP
jgi:hypothetical protein